MQSEVAAFTKMKVDFLEKQKQLEALISRKERDISDLLNKLNETISYYEIKLERKEEQIWSMTYQINEVQKSSAAQVAAVIKEKTQFGVDSTTLTDLEKKFQNKEKALQEEAEKASSESKAKDDKIAALNDQIIELSKKQFAPRMERLKVIERDIRDRMAEYAIAEERMEVNKKSINAYRLASHAQKT